MIGAPDGEPVPRGWVARSDEKVARSLFAVAEPGPSRRRVMAVDGRSGAGKSTVAARLSAAVPHSAVVHTDDIAWSESFFDWHGLLLDGVLVPFRDGRTISFRPPAWDRRQRAGAVSVPHGTELLIVEGVGAARLALADQLDAVVWVQSDLAEAERRGVERDAAGRSDPQEFWDRWQAEERPFLAADRPWDRADLVVCGTPELTAVSLDSSRQLLVGTA